MLIDKWLKPLYAPEMEGGSEAPADTGAPPAAPPLNETPVDGPGSGRSTLRKQLEKNVETVRKSEEQAAKPQREPQKSRARQELEKQEQEDAESQQAAPAEGEQEQPTEQPEHKAPEGWAKEAKAEWEKLPAPVQAAVAKREADMAKGVEEIKKKYSEIDLALQPRMETIRRHGHTPAQAVNQLFAWFEALSANPVVAFPALAQSFRFDLKNIPGMVAQQQQAAPAAPVAPKAGDAPAEEVPTYVKSLEQQLQELKQGFTQQLSQVTNTFQAQSQARTEENLMQWAKDKPYFEDVRKTMANLIMSQTVPPLPNGNADLDKAYDMALWALPEVRAKVQAEQQTKAEEARKTKIAAEKKAQQELADKARKASGSLVPGAPGTGAPPAKAKKGKSVRESIMDARAELAE